MYNPWLDLLFRLFAQGNRKQTALQAQIILAEYLNRICVHIVWDISTLQIYEQYFNYSKESYRKKINIFRIKAKVNDKSSFLSIVSS